MGLLQGLEFIEEITTIIEDVALGIPAMTSCNTWQKWLLLRYVNF